MAEQEFIVRVPPRDENKKYHVMKFRASLNQDFSKWTATRMMRENNEKIYKSNIPENEDPKYGAGSVFGKDVKEELRLKKAGITRKKYDPDAQPWTMRVNGKGGKRFKGIREGGVSDNTSFYVFTHGKDGAFEAFPISEWYNFTPIQRYKTFDAEEAEERYANRGKMLNKWAVVVSKKVKPGEEGDGEDLDGDEAKGKKGKKKGDNFKISDMDEWGDDEEGDALDTDSDEEKPKKKDSDSDSDGGGKKKKSKDTKRKKKKNKTDVDEAFEDSDDGDDEGREVDYMSDESSESEEELEKEHDIKGVDQDEGISKMLDSDSSDDEDKKKSDNEDDEDETGKKKKGKGESGDEDDDKKGKKKKGSSAANSRSATPTKEMEKMDRDQKRKAMVANVLDPNNIGESAAKKSRLEQFGTSGSSSTSASGAFGEINEEAVRKYLKRRPMTTTDLLKKFKPKNIDVEAKSLLVQHLANVIKKVNPHKQKRQGNVYLSLVEEK